MMLQLKVIWHLFNLCAIAFAWTVHGSTGFSVFTSKDTFSSFPPVEEQNHAYVPSAAPFSNGSSLHPPLTSHGLESSPPGPKLPSTPAVSPTQSAVTPSPTVPFHDTTTSQQSAASPKPLASLPPDVPLHDLAPQKPTQALAPHASTPSQASVPIHVPNPASSTVPLPPVKHTSVPLPPVTPPVLPLHSYVAPPHLPSGYASPPSIVAMPSRTVSALSPSPLLQVMPSSVPSRDSGSSPTLPPDVFAPPRNLGPSHSLPPPPQAIPSDVTASPHPSATSPITMPPPVLAPPPSHMPIFSAPPSIVLSSPPEAPPSHDLGPPPKATISEHSSPPLSSNPPRQASNPPSHAMPPIISSPPPFKSHFSAPPPNSTIPQHSSSPPPTPATNTTIQPRDAAPPTVPLPPLDAAPPSHDVASSPPTPSIHGSNPPPTVSSPPPDAAPSHDLAPSPAGGSHFSASPPNATTAQQSSAPPTPATHASNPPPDAVPPTVSLPPPDAAPSHDLAPSPTVVSHFSAPPPNATISQQSSAPPPSTQPKHAPKPPPDAVRPTVSSPPPDAAPSHDLAPSPAGVSHFSAPPPNATTAQQSSAPPTPATHASNPPPDAVPPTVSLPPPDAAPSHDLAPSPTVVSHFSAPPPNATISQQSSAPPPSTQPKHAPKPPPDAVRPTVSSPPPDAAPSHDLAPSPAGVSHFSAPPPNATTAQQSSAPPTPATHASNPPPDAVPPTVSLPPPDAAPSHDLAPSPTVVSHFSAPPPNATISQQSSAPLPSTRPKHAPKPPPDAVRPTVSSPPPDAAPSHDLAPSPTAVSHFSAPPPNATIAEQSSAPPTPATHASNPPPDAVPPTVSLPPPDAAPSHDLAPSPTVVSHFSAPPPNATTSQQSSAPPPSTLPKHAPNPPPDAVPPTVSLPPPDRAPSHDFAPSPTVVSHFSAPPTSSATSKNGSYSPSGSVTSNASAPSATAEPPLTASPPFIHTFPSAPLPPVTSNSSAPLAAPPARSPSVNPVLPREPPSFAPEAQLPHVSSPAPSIDHKGDRVPVPVAAPSGPTYTLSPTNYHPEQGFSPSTAPSIHKPRGMPSLAPISTFSPAPKQQGSSEAMTPAQSPLTKDDISPVPMSAVPVTSGHSMTPFLSPEISPSAREPIIELAPPILALPPPPPNQDCLSYTCLEPYTNTIPGSPCGCVLPMKVELRIGVALYTFFPLVPELAHEIATGVFMRQSQVRVMGANAASDKPDKTLLLIDLVPLGDKFDNITALLIFERFWNKQVDISKSLFGDYQVLYVQYPGLPASPPMAPSDVAAINGGPYPGENGSKINPLGVDVRNQGRKHRLSGSLIAIIVLSAVGVMLMGLLLGWILLFRHRRHTNQLAEAPHVHPSSIARLTGPTGQSAGSRPSFSLSFESSVAAYTGSAKTFSAVEIERATDNFNPSRVLGEGGFGLVYSATLEDGAEVAVKVLKREDQQGGREFLAEIEMLSRLHHRNLVKLIGICAEEHIHCLIYELIPNGSVESHLHGIDKQISPLDWASRVKIALGAARGLAYLHEDSSPRVIHRDFKASNILLEADFTPKVSDFGLARTAMDEENRHISTRVMGTFGYVAPEYAMTGHLLVKSDVYSYGVVLLELLTGRKPVDMSQPSGQENLVSWTRPYLTTKEALKSIVDPNLGPDISFDSVAKVAAIASMCVQPEVSHRPFMGEVVQALKLVCNECDDDSKDDSSRSENEYHEARDRDVEKALSVSDVFSGAGHGLGCKESGSDSFRRHSSSGPIGGGRSWRFWKRGSTTSSREDVGGGENGVYRFWSGSH